MNNEIISKKYEIYLYAFQHFEDIKNKAKELNVEIKELKKPYTNGAMAEILFLVGLKGKRKDLEILNKFIKKIAQNYFDVQD